MSCIWGILKLRTSLTHFLCIYNTCWQFRYFCQRNTTSICTRHITQISACRQIRYMSQCFGILKCRRHTFYRIWDILYIFQGINPLKCVIQTGRCYSFFKRNGCNRIIIILFIVHPWKITCIIFEDIPRPFKT